jgi:hypothetical protein
VKTWTQHESWLNPDGKTVCARCGVELPRLLPVQQTIYTSGTYLSLGPRADAEKCKQSRFDTADVSSYQ